MQIQRVLALATLASAILISTAATDAMNLNLVCPWNDKCSSPQTAYLAFHSPQSADMLFDRASLRAEQSSLEFVCQAGLRTVGLTWTLHRNMIDKPFRSGKAEALPANQFRIRIVPEGLPPGFYDLKVILDTGMRSIDPKDQRPVRGVCTFGWRAAEMAVRNSRPADFNTFWERAKARLAAIPLDVRNETPMQTFNRPQIDAYNLTSACLPADYDPQGHKVEEVESCKISFAGPDGGRVYAWLAKPKGAGPFPAMLVLPGPALRPGRGRWSTPATVIWRSTSRFTARTWICPSTRCCPAITTVSGSSRPRRTTTIMSICGWCRRSITWRLARMSMPGGSWRWAGARAAG